MKYERRRSRKGDKRNGRRIVWKGRVNDVCWRGSKALLKDHRTERQSGGEEEMTEEEGRESEGCSPFAKINPVRRLCRLVNVQAAGTGVDCVVVCPAVLRQVCSQMRLSNLGSVVVGGESLIQAVYRAQNLPGLRPCLQSPSEPSLAFVKYDMTKGRMRRREHSRGVAPTLLNGGHIKIGMILLSRDSSFEEQEDVAAHSDAQEESTFSNPAADE
ncbi:hypothetical protein O3P69_003211 [Scylla paramamosain]|uniref:Uncharacterized protein n=1 Tax=Scylla paramamosain TaxID=85552 RepID=A0AAW0UJL2_SCYPA